LAPGNPSSGLTAHAVRSSVHRTRTLYTARTRKIAITI
jgi:hypothetical protein